MSKSIPFRNDIVGSFLRPTELKQARERYAKKEITKEALTKVEDQAILKLIASQKENGLQAVTDGEFRRRWWHLDFIVALGGVTKLSFGDIRTFQDVEMKNAEGYFVSGALSFPKDHPFLEHFKFLNRHADGAVAKQTIPGPNMIYASGVLFSPTYQANPAYPTLKELEVALIQTYKDAIQGFYDAGCRYLQLDDTAWGALFDPASLERIKGLGYSPQDLVETFGNITEAAIAAKPADMALTFHFCRGNFKSSWIYEGCYDTIAKRLLSIENFDGFFLEYDNPRSGDFSPLAHLKNQKIVLGLITSKNPALEDAAFLLDRVKQASEFVPLEQICISPQCGFASTEEGNTLTEEEQWAKIRLVTQAAALIDQLVLGE